LDVLLDQGLKLLVASDRFTQGGDLILRNIPRDVFAVFPSLVVVIGAVGALAEDAEFAAFQVRELGDLVQENLSVMGVFMGDVYSYLHTLATKKKQTELLPSKRLAPRKNFAAPTARGTPEVPAEGALTA